MNTPLRSSPAVRRARMGGFTLIEFMVAVTIGLFIAGALSVAYIYMKNAYVSQNSLAQLEDNERLAMAVLTRSVESSGHYLYPKDQTISQALVPDTVNTPNFSAGQYIKGIVAASSSGTDTLATRYEQNVGSVVEDCQGNVNKTAAQQIVLNIFTVNQTNNYLTCQTSITQVGAAAPAAAGAAVNLVPNVKSFTVLYGVNMSGTGAGVPLRFYTANSVPFWRQVKSVKITLTMVNPLATGPLGTQPATIQWIKSIAVMGNP